MSRRREGRSLGVATRNRARSPIMSRYFWKEQVNPLVLFGDVSLALLPTKSRRISHVTFFCFARRMVADVPARQHLPASNEDELPASMSEAPALLVPCL